MDVWMEAMIITVVVHDCMHVVLIGTACVAWS